MQYNTKTEQETINLGGKIAKKLKGGDIVLLKGELGAGKTTLTKGIGEYFKIKNITSPTFTLMNIYEIKKPKNNIKNLIHIDTYRLKNEQDLIEIGIEDYLGKKNTLCLIEWPEKIKELLKNKKIIKIEIKHNKERREIEIIKQS